MIQGETKTEANYRAVSLDSSSSLKEFSMDRKKYHRKYILNEVVDDKDNQSILMGKLVETLLYEPELFDKKFYMSACASAPTGLGLKLVMSLVDATINNTDETGRVTMSFGDRFKIAYEESGYKLPFETVLKKFTGSDSEIYFEEVLNVKMWNMSVTTPQDVSNAERIVEELRSNPITAGIVNMISDTRYTVAYQLQTEDFEIDGLRLKAMKDQVVIDHEKKTLQIYDLKCVWAVENFLEEYYLYRRAYIQAYVYKKAGEAIVKNDPELEGYSVLNPKFIVCDSINYYSPLIYTLSDSDITDAYEGFEYKGRKYPGVKSIISDLKWATENNVWEISKKNHELGGVIPIRQL